ncbi:hypothetical protein BGP_6010 [Beggiatoa sp. PS]|nr:hypothetical protein BGP_6010 [Beggiatoa sp. PS]
MLQTIKAFVDTNKQIKLLEPIKFAKKSALVIILNDNETTTSIENVMEAEMIAALKQDAEDRVYQEEIMAWDNVVGDGIDAKK